MRSTLRLAIFLICCSTALAQTRPAARGPNGNRLDQLRTSLQSLGLSDDQQEKVKSLIQETRGKLEALRGDKADRSARMEKGQAILAEVRTKVKAILTPEQQEKLRNAMGDAKPSTAPATAPSSTPPSAEKTGAANEKTGRLPAAEPRVVVAAAGSVAPDFTLRRIDGPNLTLAQSRGKVTLVVFGAYSSPTFRDHAPQLEQFRREYGNRLSELVIYTREPHAAGDWEVDRNKDASIVISQAQTLNDRVAAAKQMQSALKLSLPVVLDGIDNATATAYAAEADTALLIGRDGTILTRQKWFEPYAMRHAIDDALTDAKPAT